MLGNIVSIYNIITYTVLKQLSSSMIRMEGRMEKFEKSVNVCSSKLEKQPMNRSTDSSTNNINPAPVTSTPKRHKRVKAKTYC